jgi:hypothetical protein
MDAHRERMEARMDVWLEEMKAWQTEMVACQEETEACLEKLKVNSEKVKASLEEMEAVGCLRRKVEQNGHHRFGGQSRKVGGRSGASGSP